MNIRWVNRLKANATSQLNAPAHFSALALNGRLGSYSVWHDPIPLTLAQPQHLYFSLYQRLGLLSRAEMQQPHSIFLCPHITFDVHLPPLKIA